MKKTKNSISTFIGFADCITITGLFLAIISIFASLTDHLITAAILILGSALCDLFDGPVARKRNKESPFGVALDGFNDFVTHLYPSLLALPTTWRSLRSDVDFVPCNGSLYDFLHQDQKTVSQVIQTTKSIEST